MKNRKRQQVTSGFTQAGVYARRNICANLEVYRPPEPLWNPRLREAATTLEAMRGLHKVLVGHTRKNIQFLENIDKSAIKVVPL